MKRNENSLFLLWEVSLKTTYDKLKLSVDTNINNDLQYVALLDLMAQLVGPLQKQFMVMLPYLYSGCERKGQEQSQFY